MLLGRSGEMCYLNKLLMLSVLGWLFQVDANNFFFSIISIPVVRFFFFSLTPFMMNFSQIPVIPEDIFFTSEFTEVAKLEESDDNSAELVSKTFHRVFFSLKTVVFRSHVGAPCHISGQHSVGGSAAPLHVLSVPGQVFVFCRPSERSTRATRLSLADFFLCVCVSVAGEFRKLLAAFVSGSTSKSSGIVRKITPTSAEPKDAQVANRSQQKLQVSPGGEMM